MDNVVFRVSKGTEMQKGRALVIASRSCGAVKNLQSRRHCNESMA